VSWLHWALLSALFAGLTAVLAKVGVKDVDSDLAMAIRTSVILVFAWAIALVRNAQTMATAMTDTRTLLAAVTAKTWLFLVLSGLATGASWLCYFRALKLGEAAQVAPIDKLSVVVAMLLAVLVLGERLSWQQWAGGALIVTGAVVLATG
jgi:bacterial/archaeal transporter family protein